jgi:hypothetical protein
MAPWLDRMDRHYFDKGIFNDSHLKMTPSEYFRRQCRISFEPVEGDQGGTPCLTPKDESTMTPTPM